MNLSKLLWLPLSLSIFGVDLIQRGFGTFAKDQDFMIPHLAQALSIYFIVMSLGVLIGGYLCDNMNSRKVLLWSTILGAIGVITLPYTPWGFGLIFGAAASLIKIAPFSAPLKLYDGKDAIRVCPQAAAKNVSGALFILFLGTIFATIGWVWSAVILSSIFLISGLMTYKVLPDDKIDGWKFDIFLKLSKDWKFWMMSVYFFLMCGWYYLAIAGFYPAFTKGIGLNRYTALTIIAVSYLCAGALRWVLSWLGDQKIKGYKIRLSLMWVGTFGMGLCILLTPIIPFFSLFLFTLFSSIHTPNYWSYCKEKWGPLYISTVVSLGFFFMYLGAGVMYGAWFK